MRACKRARQRDSVLTLALAQTISASLALVDARTLPLVLALSSAHTLTLSLALELTLCLLMFYVMSRLALAPSLTPGSVSHSHVLCRSRAYCRSR